MRWRFKSRSSARARLFQANATLIRRVAKAMLGVTIGPVAERFGHRLHPAEPGRGGVVDPHPDIVGQGIGRQAFEAQAHACLQFLGRLLLVGSVGKTVPHQPGRLPEQLVADELAARRASGCGSEARCFTVWAHMREVWTNPTLVRVAKGMK